MCERKKKHNAAQAVLRMRQLPLLSSSSKRKQQNKDMQREREKMNLSCVDGEKKLSE